jgi:hypothetical protein
MITGPSASGGSGENERIQAIRAKFEEIRTEKIEKMQEEYEAKKDVDEDFDPEAVDRESLKIRIPDEILYKLL